jgi:hypothetical protein
MKRFLAALAALVCAVSAHAIVNGTLADEGDAIARSTVMVACIDTLSGADILVGSASGVIVADGIVLTAGHIFSMCRHGQAGGTGAGQRWELRFGLDGKDAKAPAVAIGPGDLLNDDVPRLLAPLHIEHERYRDYALVRVPGGLPAGVRPMRIAPASALPSKGTLVHFAGYGFIQPGWTDYRLRTVRLPVTSVDAGQPAMPPLGKHFSAFDRQYYVDFHSRSRHACVGDSGGPFYTLDQGEPVLVAILTHVRNAPGGKGFCDGPAVGLRNEAFADELSRVLERVAR